MSEAKSLERLDQYLAIVDERVRTSRRASEVFFDMPPLDTAIEGERLINNDLDTTYKDFVTPKNDQLIADNQSFSTVTDEYWDKAQHVGEISGTYPGAGLADYFYVDIERSEKAIRDMIHAEYALNSPPRLLLRGIEGYSRELDIDIMTAARVTTKHLLLQLPSMKIRARELVEQEDIGELDATSRVFEEFVETSIAEHIKTVKDSSDTSLFHGFINKVTPPDQLALLDDAPPLRLNRLDATGLAKVYKLERRPYSDTELQLADELARMPLIQATLLTFQMAIVEYTTDYLNAHPERAAHSMLPFSEFFVPIGQDLAPNPKLLKVLCNNYLPALAGHMMAHSIHVDDLVAGDFSVAAIDARKRRVFFAQIGKFNNFDSATDTVELDAFVSRVCPAMQTLTNGLATWMPKIYDTLRTI